MTDKKNPCVSCGGGPVTREVRNVAFDYKGETLDYDQPGEWCATCGEGFLDASDTESTDLLWYDFQAKVDGRLTTGDLRRIRKKLGLTQKQAGEVIGGGPNAFNRYETGKTYPTKGTENFLLLLDKHPHLITELIPEEAA